MPQISLELRRIPFVTERGRSVPASRLFVRAHFLSAPNRRIPYPAFVDTGAAYSVIPYRLAKQVRWSALGSRLILATKSRAVEWLGLPAEMGELEIELVDTQSAVRTQRLQLVAKVVSQSASPHVESFAILGMNFILDNHAFLEMDATGQRFTGSLWVP